MFFLQYFSYFVTVAIALIVFSVIGMQKRFPGWLKWVASIYYLIPLPLLEYLQKRLADKWYKTTPVPDEYWDLNSRLADIFSALFFIPAIVLLVALYIQWFKNTKQTDKRIYLSISILPIMVAGAVVYTFFEFTYGYQP